MKRLEERVTCQDASGVRYVVEVFREITRMADDSQEVGLREAFIDGDRSRPVNILAVEDTFEIVQTRTVLRRVKDATSP